MDGGGGMGSPASPASSHGGGPGDQDFRIDQLEGQPHQQPLSTFVGEGGHFQSSNLQQLRQLHQNQQQLMQQVAKGVTKFWPEKPKADAQAKASTVLTNLQRGNIPTLQTVVQPPVTLNLHQRAGQGELKMSEFQGAGNFMDDDGLVNVNERDERGKTPLMWSAAYGQTPTVNMLLKLGADVNARACEDETALHLAAANGHHDSVRILLKQGAEVDPEDENGCTPLMFAALKNHAHCVNELLGHGADFARNNVEGETALSLAVRQRSLQAQCVIENHICTALKSLVCRTTSSDENRSTTTTTLASSTKASPPSTLSGCD